MESTRQGVWPRTIQEHRGITTPPAERTERYSAASYSAQYGIPVEDAEEIRESCNTHQQVERGIFALYKLKPDLKERALFREPEPELTEAQKKKMEMGGVDVSAMVEDARNGEEAS